MKDLDIYNYIKKNKNTFIITVWPVCQNGDNIITKNYTTEFCKIIYYKEIKLDPASYKNFLYHISDKNNHPLGVELWFAKPYSDNTPLKIYVIETSPNTLNINLNIIRTYLINIFSNNTNYITMIENKYGIDAIKNLYITTMIKRKSRTELSNKGYVMKVLQETKPFNYSHHVNDFHYETIELGKLLFNENTLKLLKYFKWNVLPGFEKKFSNFKNFLLKNHIDTDNIIIYNSGILGPFGLREPNDIDFLQLDKVLIKQSQLPPDIDIQNIYFKRGYMILQNKDKAQYMEDNPSFMQNIELNNPKIIWKLSLHEILFNPENYFYYKGLKFMSPKLFNKVKKIRGRPKDLQQIQILNKILN